MSRFFSTRMKTESQVTATRNLRPDTIHNTPQPVKDLFHQISLPSSLFALFLQEITAPFQRAMCLVFAACHIVNFLAKHKFGWFWACASFSCGKERSPPDWDKDKKVHFFWKSTLGIQRVKSVRDAMPICVWCRKLATHWARDGCRLTGLQGITNAGLELSTRDMQLHAAVICCVTLRKSILQLLPSCVLHFQYNLPNCFLPDFRWQ